MYWGSQSIGADIYRLDSQKLKGVIKTTRENSQSVLCMMNLFLLCIPSNNAYVMCLEY